MIALMNVEKRPIALEADFIESVEGADGEDYGVAEACLVRTNSGQVHVIERSYTYVTGIIRKHYETR